MQLEDHSGDVIRKARLMNGVSAAAAASVAGISEGELSALETSGNCARKINFPALGNLLGVNPQKLARIAAGWLPAPQNLAAWRQLRVFSTAAEGLTVNCFLVWDETSRDAALFDTGVDARPVLDCIAENGLRLRHIFITHSHWDHIEALPAMTAAFPDARVHTGSINAPAARRNQPGEIIALGTLRIAHRETPGHAGDGATYIISGWLGQTRDVAVVGDAIFAGSIGRGNQSWQLAIEKVREHILSLPAETLICPGHGPLTTVGEEREGNPFF